MSNTAIEVADTGYSQEDLEQYYDEDIVAMQPIIDTIEPLYGDFISEIAVWARRALASNGFGDF